MQSSTPSRKRGPAVRRLCCAVAMCAALAACGATYRNYGYVPTAEELDQIAVGVDTRASVEETLGSSAAGSVLQDDAMYFVRSRVKNFALLDSEVVERTIVAISFDSAGVVRNVETFGLEDGQVVPLARRVTDTTVEGRTFLGQLFGNIGRFTPSGIDG